MRRNLIVTATLVASMSLTGCMRSMTSTTFRPDVTSVSVRFVAPSEQEMVADVDAQANTQLVVDSSYEGFSGQEYTGDATFWSPGAYHVALWGGPYEGTNVTTRVTALLPGSYTFALFDQPNDTVMQGWLDVRNTGSDLVSVLTKWRNGIPEQKQRLAYDLEIDGRMTVSDPEVFDSFKKQMQAFTRLEHRLEAAIKAESKAQTAWQWGIRDLLRRADVVIMPGEGSFFRPTTQPVLGEDDLEAVRNGDVVTKMILAADYEEAQWKLRRLNQLYDDLSRFKEVLRQEVDRLERRKGLFLLTDHLHNHDKRFVENEARLQYTLGLMDRFDRHTSDLRERRMALAFMTSLFTPDTSFSALDQEQRNLRRERIVFETERQRLDQLFAEADEQSARRVTLERSRQDIMGAIDAIDEQIENIEEARNVLLTMVESTDVIHRHNDTRLLTTTFVADRLPPRIRQAVEQEAMLTIRLQESDKVFAPRPTGVAETGYTPVPAYADEPFLNDEQRVSYVETFEGTADHATTLARHPEEWRDWDVDQKQQAEYKPKDKSRGCPWFIRLLVPPCWFAKASHPARTDARQGARSDKDRTTTLADYRDKQRDWQDDHRKQPWDEQAKKRSGCPWFIRLLVPPCWFAEASRPAQTYTPQGSYTDKDRTTTLADYRDTQRDRQDDYGTQSRYEQEKKRDGCPWFIRLLVPPCWFAEASSPARTHAPQGSHTDKDRTTTLADYRDKQTDWQDDHRKQPRDEQEKKRDECPWFIRLLVPPCWLAD